MAKLFRPTPASAISSRPSKGNGEWKAWLPSYKEGQGLVWEREGDHEPMEDRPFRMRLLITRPGTAIELDTEAGVLPILPVIDRLRPWGSTSEVLFCTARPAVGITKRHITHVVLDAPNWEPSIAYQLERLPEVVSYVRNDCLDFLILYEWQGAQHEYRPDYLVRWSLQDGREVKLIIEVKGFETEQDRQKEAAARRWVRAVNHHGEFGRWAFCVCNVPQRIKQTILQCLQE